MNLERRRFVSGSLAATAALLASLENSMAQPAKVLLGTATPGGGFPAYGAALIEALSTADSDLLIEARNTKGSTENVPMLERGDLDLGLVTGEVLHEALAGIGRPPANVKVLAAMYSQPGMFVALTALHAALTISTEKLSLSALLAPAWLSLLATSSTDWGSIPSATFKRSISSGPATGLPWCLTVGSQLCGVPGAVGPGLSRSHAVRRRRASSLRPTKKWRASLRSTHS